MYFGLSFPEHVRKSWLCNAATCMEGAQPDKPSLAQAITDMEEVFLNLGLDIIGLGVFNYDFNSITKESPVIKVCPNIPLPSVSTCTLCLSCAGAHLAAVSGPNAGM